MSGALTRSPVACDSCLRRMRLVGLLAPFIEKVASGAPGARSPELLRLDDEALIEAVGGARARGILDRVRHGSLRELREAIAAAGCWAVCRDDDAYPEALRDAADAPPALVGCGAQSRMGRLRPEGTVTVVGARRATAYGRQVARQLGRELAAAGFVVVSGLAWGVDGCAHHGALDGGLTVAVLGCGCDVPYPRHNARIHGRVREKGVVLSELPPGTAPWRWTFPARNRIMAALGAMTVVVEAAGRSGSLITAELASELGRDVGAVPGPVGARMSAGTNQLIADGARLVRDAEDVLDALIGPGRVRRPSWGPPLDARLAAVLERVEAGDADPDSIAIALGRPAGEAIADMLRLELLGYLHRSFGGSYSRTSLAPGAAVPAGARPGG